jgi:hypothetical protein
VGIHWEVTEEKGYYYFGENKFFEEKSGLLNSYTPAMREMNADFRDNFRKGDIDPQANYVFILKYSGSTMDRDAAGFMPRGGQFGYIFTKDFQGDAEILQTIAHELGHGKLLLKHTFDKDYGIAQGTTDNLMDYAKGKTHLAKWQWDILADPGIAQGVFDSDEDGMVGWIIINKKYTLLFNHLYDKHHSGNWYYSNILQKQSSNSTLNLNYNGEEKVWIDEWKLHSSDQQISDIINTVQNTKKDSIMSFSSLFDKGIFIGKHSIEGTEYPIIVYSRTNTVQNITKVRVLKNSDLDKDEQKRHLLRDETYIKYIVIAFYTNNENEPSLILQIEKFDISKTQNTMQVWLEYLGIIGGEEPLLKVQIFNGETPINNNSFVMITNEPSMPNIRVICTGNALPDDYEIKMRLKIFYKRNGVDNNGAALNNIRNDSILYPSDDWQNALVNDEWRVNLGNNMYGGKAYLLYQHDEQTDTIVFFIRGINPSATQIRNYINEQGYDQYWFIIKMTRQESSLLQFGGGTNYSRNWQTGRGNTSGEPLYGPPRGFGLKQLDNWGNNQHATSQHLWNWKTNIDAGVEVIREKATIVNHYRNEHNEIINGWNRGHQDDPVSDSLFIEAGENAETTVLTITEGNETFAVNPTGNQRDIYDALWIKLFNGGIYYRIIESTDDEGNPIKPYRVINRINNLNRNYVRTVCNQPDE